MVARGYNVGITAGENISFSGDSLQSTYAVNETVEAVELQTRKDEEAVHLHSRPSTSIEALKFDDEQQVSIVSTNRYLQSQSSLPIQDSIY